MKIRPILFSTAMVMAITEGRKTETRRIIKPQPDDDGLWDHGKHPMSLEDDIAGWYGTVEETGESRDFTCRYGIEGDILYVRESWCYAKDNNVQMSAEERHSIIYKASEHGAEFEKTFEFETKVKLGFLGINLSL